MTRRHERPLRSRSAYEAALCRRVCSRCVDFGVDHICHGSDPEGCGVFRFLPELVAIAKSLDELRMEPYIARVRQEICSQCRARSPEGFCELRSRVDCGLDRYLPLVLEAIEEVEGFERKT